MLLFVPSMLHVAQERPQFLYYITLLLKDVMLDIFIFITRTFSLFIKSKHYNTGFKSSVRMLFYIVCKRKIVKG